MNRICSVAGRRTARLAAVALLGLAVAHSGAQQLTPDQAAALVLNSARKAYNEGKYDFAVERFREFLQKYSGHQDAMAARYGLGLALLEGPGRNFTEAAKTLQQVAGQGNFADHPFASYYLGVATRGMGYEMLARIPAQPDQEANLQKSAKQRFLEAERSLAAAADELTVRLKAPPPAATEMPDDVQWAARARCDQCEMLLRLEKFEEARKIIQAMLSHPLLSKSRCRELALYHLGYAEFSLNDGLAAGRALAQLAPFGQDFGVHARFLLARVHHLAGQRPEAAALYQALLGAYEQQKQAAQATLKNPQALPRQQLETLQALVNGPPPEYVPRSAFYLALLQAEQGQYADAIKSFGELIQRYPKLPLAAEAQVRQGFCQVQLKSYPEATRILQPLCNHPQVGWQAFWWLGRAQAAAANPADAGAYAQALQQAMDSFRRASELTKSRPNDPDVRARRADILMDLADTQQLVGQHKEALATYQRVLDDRPSDRDEEAMQRRATAMHLAGMYSQSDELCRRFEQTYPKSTLLSAVLFREAENAYMSALAAESSDKPKRPQEVERLFEEAVKRYRRLLAEHAGFAYANQARQGLATACYRLERYPETIAALRAIPETDRTGDLAPVSYLLADSLIRTFPTETDNALGAARLLSSAGDAVKLLQTYIGANPKGADTPDALLKLGYCYRRVAALTVDRTERQKVLGAARQTFEQLMNTFPQHKAMPYAVFARAECLADLGDPGTSGNEFRRFAAGPLGDSDVAPVALARVATWLCRQGNPAEAARILGEYRARREAALLQDTSQRGRVAMLRQAHALALKQAGKAAEARAIYDSLAADFTGQLEGADAVWRAAQCLREDLAEQLAAAIKTTERADAKAEEIAAAEKAVDQAVAKLRPAIDALQAQAENLSRAAPGSQAHQHVLYELAWCYRAASESELYAARKKRGKELLDKARAAAEQAPSPVAPSPQLLAPEVPLSSLPVGPAEAAARARYEALIAAAPDCPLAVQARLELAEMHAQRDNDSAALILLAEALAKGPPPRLAMQIRLRLAASCLAKGDGRAALTHVETIGKDAQGTQAAEARFLAGEAYIQQKDWAKAVEQLQPFRDQAPLQRVANVSDRALARLGYACAQLKQWDDARRALEILRERFRTSDWIGEGLYQLGQVWEAQNQFDRAIASYTEATRSTVSEAAARAQLQIGLCHLAQKRYDEAVKALLAVPFTYDYPELSARAWYEAGRAHAENKQAAEAARLFRRLLEQYPRSPWAETARQRLAEIK